MNGFTLTKFYWHVMSHDEKKILTLAHAGLFHYFIEMNNRLRWIDVIGVPRLHTMEQLNIGSRNTYRKLFRDLERMGLIEVVQKSKTKHEATKITLNTTRFIAYCEVQAVKKQSRKQKRMVKI